GVEAGCIATRPVQHGTVLRFEQGRIVVLADEVEVLVVRPHPVAAAGCRLHELAELVDLRLGMGVGADLGNGAAVRGAGLGDDDPAEVLQLVLLAVLENRDARSATGLAAGVVDHRDGEVGLHVVRVDAVLMNEGAGDVLAYLLGLGELHHLVAADVVEDLVVGKLARPCGRLAGVLLGGLPGRLRLARTLLRHVEAQLFLSHRDECPSVPSCRTAHRPPPDRRHRPRLGQPGTGFLQPRAARSPRCFPVVSGLSPRPNRARYPHPVRQWPSDRRRGRTGTLRRGHASNASPVPADGSPWPRPASDVPAGTERTPRRPPPTRAAWS